MNNLIVGSNRREELSGNKMPENYFKDISATQISSGLKALEQLEEINSIRRENAIEYSRILKANGKVFLNEDLFDNHLFLKYPLLVKDRESFFKHAEKEKVILGDWFLSPIHPVRGNFDLWKFKPDFYPVAVNISKQIVNLPTDIKDNRKVLEFINKNLEDII